MREGTSVKLSLSSPKFTGETLPKWISDIKGQPSVLDASAVLHVSDSGQRSLRVAVVNRSEKESFRVPIRIAFEERSFEGADAHIYELYHEDVHVKNGWGRENEVSVKERHAQWDGGWTFKEHSFTLLVLTAR